VLIASVANDPKRTSVPIVRAGSVHLHCLEPLDGNSKLSSHPCWERLFIDGTHGRRRLIIRLIYAGVLGKTILTYYEYGGGK
jgi:hypothetical protein